MKIEHLAYILEIAECGSMNKASQKLMLPQPSLSSAVKTLESELGFNIFLRTNKGIVPTQQGQELISHAAKIMMEHDSIQSIKTGERVTKFHLSAGYHTATEEAFALLCCKYKNGGKFNFSIRNLDVTEVVENVYSNKSDIGISLLPQETPAEILSLTKKKNLDIITIGKLYYTINLRRGHPWLESDEPDIANLKNYPFVDYGKNILSNSVQLISLGIIDPDKCITIDDRDTRCNIVTNSDAFTISCGIHKRTSSKYNWVSTPLGEDEFKMVYFQKKNQRLTPVTKEYLNILKEEFTNIL